MFAGFVQQENTLHFSVQTRLGDLPINADDFPNFRVYSGQGLMPSAGGQASYRQTGAIIGATNASPIVLNSIGHSLTTGMRVNVSGVGGNTAANGTWTITVVDADHFSLDGSVGNSIYTAGGTWKVAGLYDIALVATGANGFSSGQAYAVAVTYKISGTPYTQVFTVQVT